MWLTTGPPEITAGVGQIDKESDRAAALVMGSIVEIRFREALKNKFQKHPTLPEKMFRSSGALFNFGVKIDLAYLLGMLSEDAYADSTNLCSIRNDFAHRLDVENFSTQTIKDRCFNFKLVEKSLLVISNEQFAALHNSISYEERIETAKTLFGIQASKGAPMWLTTNADELLNDARQRYLMTAQLLNYALGSAHWEHRSSELI